jgi:hypothetical protein
VNPARPRRLRLVHYTRTASSEPPICTCTSTCPCIWTSTPAFTKTLPRYTPHRLINSIRSRRNIADIPKPLDRSRSSFRSTDRDRNPSRIVQRGINLDRPGEARLFDVQSLVSRERSSCSPARREDSHLLRGIEEYKWCFVQVAFVVLIP